MLAAFIAKQWDNVAQSDSVALINVPSVDIRNVMIGNAVSMCVCACVHVSVHVNVYVYVCIQAHVHVILCVLTHVGI